MLSRGTARRIGYMAPFVGGKTGTSTDWNDAWFVGFTNDVTVAVWVGYDNAGGKRRTLGSGGTGSGTAIPIFEPIIKASWEHVAPKLALSGPSPEVHGQVIATGGRADERDRKTKKSAFVEYLRVDSSGRVATSNYRTGTTDGYQRRERREQRYERRIRPTYDFGYNGWGFGYSGSRGFGNWW